MQASRKNPGGDTIEFDEPSYEERTGPEDIAATARQITATVEAGVRDQMEQRPYASMAVAFGLGYVLGGGLPKMAVRAATTVGIRFAALHFLRKIFPSEGDE